MNLSYAVICATLTRMNVNLMWADEQYPATLFKVIGEFAKMGKKPEKKKVGSSNIGKFIA